jgi:hypothetical protein
MSSNRMTRKMRFFSVKLLLLSTILIGACDLLLSELGPLADSVSQQVSGETSAWLMAGDVVVIEVAGSPLYQATQPELEAQATSIAEQAIEFTGSRLESIIITFYEAEVTDAEEQMREFFFLVMENRPVLQPYLDIDATGPLTAGEIQAAMDRLGEKLPENQRECVREELERRAHDAGDPELLDPANVNVLTAETWNKLDAFSKRLFLSAALETEAMFACARHSSD